MFLFNNTYVICACLSCHMANQRSAIRCGSHLPVKASLPLMISGTDTDLTCADVPRNNNSYLTATKWRLALLDRKQLLNSVFQNPP